MNRSLPLKAVLVAALSFLMMIPVWMIRDLVAERQARRNEAVNGIAEGWGKRQTVVGPYITVPYERAWTEVKRETVDGKERETRIERLEHPVLRLPVDRVEWTIAADIGERSRGIYRARLYTMRLLARGSVMLPPRGSLEDGTSRYRWSAARLSIGISDAAGIRAATDATVDGRPVPFSPGSGDATAPAGLQATLGELQPGWQPTAFAFTLELAGSEAFAIAPLGADATAAMHANWPHPSFQGRFLPAAHEVASDGFTSSWKVSKFAVQGSAAAQCAFPCSRMGDQLAVSFIEPAGVYQRLERASKYGFLFLGLTFAAFMLLEVLRRLAIHAVQYGLVGLALAMFFLLLTALSEHVAFASAYAIATSACVGLIGLYLRHPLRSPSLAMAFTAGLAALYAFLYALLQAEDYSLLGGAVLLFTLLAAVMLSSRRTDWYAATSAAPRAHAAPPGPGS
jgi:inner membrane protein